MTGARSLAGQVAIVTGASSGIGAVTARALVRAGATVLLVARRADRLNALAARLNADGAAAAIVAVADLAREEDRAALIAQAQERHGRVDILVNNAGYSQPGAVEELTPPALRAQFEINFVAATHLMALVIPPMRARGSGRIINISSVAGLLAAPGLGAYSASKFALEAISDAARVELAPFGVEVSAIEPGSIRTEIWSVGRAVGESLLRPDSPYAALYRTLLAQAARAEQRGAPPAVVARAVLHAASAQRPRARYLVPAREASLVAAFARLPSRLRDPILRRQLGHRV